MLRSSASRVIPLAGLLVFALSQSGCLKTRAQLRESGDDSIGSSAPVPVRQGPQEVQPQGEYVIDEIKGELTRINGRVEDLERTHKQQSSDAPTADEIKKLETRVVELEQAQANMLEVIKKLQENAPSNVDPAELLKKGKTQLQGDNAEGAIETFGACIKVAKGKVAEECTYMRAETYYGRKEYKKAIVDYSKFPEKYTKSSRMPRALYQIGRSFEALGMKDDAKGFYQELVEKYPKSSEAKKARSKAQ